MITTFEALSDPTRKQILDLLLERPRLVGELVDIIGMSQPGVSKHLRILREAGLVNVRQDAQRRWYEVRHEPLAELHLWLETYRHLWEEKYNRLENLLDQLQGEENHSDKT